VKAFYSDSEKRSVLVPGSGLGRLVYEFAKEGFEAQGNEFGYHMLLTGEFILNQTSEDNQFDFYPYLHNFSNLESDEQAFKKLTFPDQSPCKFFHYLQLQHLAISR